MVSICIPTYRRPQLLREAIESCIRQSYGDWEILIGDDSPDDETRRSVESLRTEHLIRYFHHQPSLGQAANVQFLFSEASGERLVLLHDDDLLVEGALERLSSAWSEDPLVDIAFGKQYISSIKNEINYNASTALNAAFYRTDDRAGVQPSSAFSGLVAQIPNDGYMIRTALARDVGYRSDEEVGGACDYDFGLRLGLKNVRVCFVPFYTAIYRISDVSVLRSGANVGEKAYYLVKHAQIPPELNAERLRMLLSKSAMAIHGHIDRGEERMALRIFLSKDYPLNRRLSLGGLRIVYRILYTRSKSLIKVVQWSRRS